MVVDLGWTSGVLPKLSYPLFLSWAGQRKSNKSLRMVNLWTGRDHSPVTVMGKTDLTWENQFNLLPKIAE